MPPRPEGESSGGELRPQGAVSMTLTWWRVRWQAAASVTSVRALRFVRALSRERRLVPHSPRARVSVSAEMDGELELRWLPVRKCLS